MGPPVDLGDKAVIPVARFGFGFGAGAGGMILCTPVALLIEEEGAWSFVSLEEGTGQDALGGPGSSTRP
jgi:uncharacterized spore protein YtfJ